MGQQATEVLSSLDLYLYFSQPCESLWDPCKLPRCFCSPHLAFDSVVRNQLWAKLAALSVDLGH